MYPHNFRSLSVFPIIDKSAHGELRRGPLKTPCAKHWILKTARTETKMQFYVEKCKESYVNVVDSRKKLQKPFPNLQL